MKIEPTMPHVLKARSSVVKMSPEVRVLIVQTTESDLLFERTRSRG